MKKILSLVLVTMMIAALAVPSFAVKSEDVPATPADENTMYLWAEDAEIDTESNTATVNVNIAHNCGFWSLKTFVAYPSCLTLTGMENAASFLKASDLTPGTEAATPTKVAKDAFTAAGKDPAAMFDGSTKYAAVYYEIGDNFDDCAKTDGPLVKLSFTYDPAANILDQTSFPIIVAPSVNGDNVHGEDSAAYAAGRDEISVVPMDGVLTLPATPPSTEATITVSDATITKGEPTATFTLTVSNNPGVWCMQGYFSYDKNMTFNSMTVGAIYSEDDFMLPSDYPQIRDVDVEAAVADTDNYPGLAQIFADSGASTAGKSMVILQAAPSAIKNKTADGMFVTMTLNTATLEPGVYEICYSNDTYSTINTDEDTILFKSVHGTLTVNDCAHANTSTETVDATCLTDGYVKVTCDDCGAVISNTVIPALGHEFTVVQETVAPKCEEEGYTVYKCVRCTETQNRDIKPATGHKWVAGEVTPPTCTEQGYTTYTCSNDPSHTKKDDFTPPEGHNYIVTTTGTCGEVGKTITTCSKCDYYNVVEGEVIKHNYEVVNELTPTCTAPGYRDTKCTICGDEKHEDLDALGHDFSVEVGTTPPDCLNQGFTTYKCVRCDETEDRDFVPALNHNYVTVTTDKPTCTVAGTDHQECTRCGDKKDVPIPALGHDIVIDEAVEPTCTTTGLTQGQHCTRCDEATIAQTTVGALGHDYDDPIETVEPTCTEQGYTVYKCIRCTETQIRDYVPSPGHDIVIDEAVAPTCTDSGLTAGQHCTKCTAPDVTVAQEIVPALGHAFTVKGATTDPTCTEKGYTTYKCERCDATEDRDFTGELGHEFTVFVKKVDPTCTEEGYTLFKCVRCDETEKRDFVKALGHDFTVEGEKVDPTCDKEGYTPFKCSRCDAVEKHDIVAALGHKWDSGVITKAPTETEDGEKTFTCSVCGEKKVEVVAKLGPAQDDPNNGSGSGSGNGGANNGGSSSGSGSGSGSRRSAQTGDSITLLVFVAIVAAIAGGTVLVIKKKELFRK